MSCKHHALCATDYAGMVDVGEARSDPKVIELSGHPSCCRCSQPAQFLLQAVTDRFNGGDETPFGRERCHVIHFRTGRESVAAAHNAVAPRGLQRSAYVVQIETPG